MGRSSVRRQHRTRLGATEEKADKGVLQNNTVHSTEVGVKQQFPLKAQTKTLVLSPLQPSITASDFFWSQQL